jgi:hypothetical protein
VDVERGEGLGEEGTSSCPSKKASERADVHPSEKAREETVLPVSHRRRELIQKAKG